MDNTNRSQPKTAELLNELKMDKKITREGAGAYRSFISITIASLLLLAILLYFKVAHSDDQSSINQSKELISLPQEVEVSAELLPPDDNALTASGYILATRQATVSSETTGRLVEIMVSEGQAVKQGDLIARLDSRLPAAQLSLAQSQLEAQRSKLQQTDVLLQEARANFARMQELSKKQLTSFEQYEKARFAVASLEAQQASVYHDIVVNEKQVAIQQEMVSNTAIYAPFTGVVVEQAAQIGEIVSPISAGGGFTRTGICTLVDTKSLEGEVYVNERFIQQVHLHQPVVVTSHAYPEFSVNGFVRAIMPSVNKETATIKVKIGLTEQHHLILPNMGIDVAFSNPDSTKADLAWR